MPLVDSDTWPTRVTSSLLGWPTATHCWVAHRWRLLTNYSASRTTWPESSVTAGVVPMPGRCFARYSGFRWGSGSPILKWLFWLTSHKVRTTVTPTYLSELVRTHAPPRALRSSDAPTLVVPRIHTELALHTFCCCSIHLVKTLSLSNATWKPIYSNSLSPPVWRICIFGPKDAIQIHYFY